jgi:Holliday junction resolvase RusA-like endonuclease
MGNNPVIINLKGEPKSTSHIYSMTCRGRFASMYMNKNGKMVKASYIKQTLEQWHSSPITGDVEIHVKLYFGTRRKADIDNFGKLILDSLTDIVWEDDSQIQKMLVEKFYCKEDPRIELSILVI